MQRVARDQVCYATSSRNKPVLEANQDELFCVETEDYYSGNLRTSHDRFTKDMWDTVNPATGPMRVRGARPGSTLRVEIVEIRTRNHAAMCVEHGAGALAGVMPIRAVCISMHAA
jgi:amidase